MYGQSASRRFLGRVLDRHGSTVGTSFRVAPRLLVTAAHVIGMARSNSSDPTVKVGTLTPNLVTEAEICEIDVRHDLAILLAREEILEPGPPLVFSDSVPPLTSVSVTGPADVQGDREQYQFIDAQGAWKGAVVRSNGTWLSRISCSDILRGMSGAPVVILGLGVVGAVSGRYNSSDGWLRDTAWISRIEDLFNLLEKASRSGRTDISNVGGRDISGLGGAAQCALDGLAISTSALRSRPNETAAPPVLQFSTRHDDGCDLDCPPCVHPIRVQVILRNAGTIDASHVSVEITAIGYGVHPYAELAHLKDTTVAPGETRLLTLYSLTGVTDRCIVSTSWQQGEELLRNDEIIHFGRDRDVDE